MHRITTPPNPVTVETAVSGTSTPSTIGQVEPATEAYRKVDADTYLPPEEQTLDDWKQVARFYVLWIDRNGNERTFGARSGGISSDNVVRLVRLLSTRGSTVFTVVKVS